MNFTVHHQLRRRRSIKSLIFALFPSDTAAPNPQLLSFKKRTSNQTSVVAIGLAGAYWLFQSLLSLLANGSAALSSALFPADTGEIFSRLLAVCLFVALGLYADYAIRRRLQAAEAAGKAQSAFLAEMSHEIRTPLSAITGMVELLRQGKVDEVRQADLEVLQAASRALLALTDDILDFSRIEKGKLELASEAFDIRALIDESMGIVTPEASRKNLDLACRIPPETPHKVLGDPARLRQVLLNLLANAVKFTDSGSIVLELAVSAETAETLGIHLSVKDTGIGIEAQKQEGIFDAFCQAAPHTSRHYGGTGLGLAISARIVGLMGGRIWVESRPGKGSTFHVTARLAKVPAVDLVAETAAAVEGQVAAAFTAPLHVLVVEDVAFNRKITARLLETWGHRVDLAATGEQAVTATDGTPYDLILMDVRMAGVDGLESARRIRKQESAAGRPRTPIIATTAHVSASDRQRCLAAGMDDCLSKPIATERLARIIRQLTAGVTAGAIPPATACFQTDIGPPAGSRMDLEALVETVGGDAGFARELVETFLDDAPKRVQAIRQALNAGKPQELGRAAHDLKGMLRGFSLENAAAASESLECMVIEKTWHKSAALELADRVAAHLADIENTTRKELGKLTARV